MIDFEHPRFAVAIWDVQAYYGCRYAYFESLGRAQAAVAYYQHVSDTRETYQIHTALIPLCEACLEHTALRHDVTHLQTHKEEK